MIVIQRLLYIILLFTLCGTVQAAEWFPAADMTTPREDHTATLLSDDRVLVVGGMRDYGVLSSAELYDPAANSWSPAADMLNSRVWHTATLLPDGRVLVAGGISFPAAAELYDPDSNSWSPAATMNIGRFFHSATLLPDGRVLVVGGEVLPGEPLATAEIYDPATNSWSFISAMSDDRSAHSATLLPSGKVLVAGGKKRTDPLSCTSDTIAASEIYDPATNSWSSAGGLTDKRSSHSSTLLSDGRVLVTGGQDEITLCGYGGLGTTISSPVASAELYNPETDSWSFADNQSHPGKYPPAVLLPDNKVLVMGDGDNPELYDPTTGDWTSAGIMTVARWWGHGATLLRSGFVLVTGGWNGSETLASAELYGDPHTPPGLTSFARQVPATNPTNADTLVFRATFDEAVQNVDASDFTINGITTAAITNVAAVTSNMVYDITVSGGDLAGFNGVVGLNLLGAQNITDLTGNALPTIEPVTDEIYALDNTEPSPPSTPDMTPETDTGVSNSDNLTSDSTPTFTGTAEPNSTVTLISSVDGFVGSATANDSGNWSIIADSGIEICGYSGCGVSFSFLANGAHNITATTKDAAGNVSAASSPLAIIIDYLSPALSGMPAPITTDTDPGLNTAVVNWIEPTANDFHDGPLTPVQTAGLANGSPFPVGLTIVTYTATDSAGNSSSESFTVAVNDNEPPLLSGMPTDMTVSTPSSNSSTATVRWIMPTAIDAVNGIVTPVQIAGVENGGEFPVGLNVVTYSATDSQSNTSTASFTVTVKQTKFPLLFIVPELLLPNRVVGH